ncbi:kinase-like domain-containing protein, partial [Chaetomium tenue]
MARLLSANASLTGRLSSYTIIKELHKAADEAAVYLARNQRDDKCIVKSIRGHWRLQNEAAILKRYQSKTPFLRPLIDEIQEPSDPPSIVLRYLDNDILTESDKKRLSRPEIKHVAKCVLEALRVLHKDGMVHTGCPPSSFLLPIWQRAQRFSDMQLGDCGGVVSQESKFAKEGHIIGAAFTRSPEAMFQLPWGTATDIWSFGNAILSLLFGGGYHLFNPQIDRVPPEDEDYELTVLKWMYRFFGPYPQSYESFNDPDTITIINFINHQEPPAKPFARVTTREIPLADKKFLLKIMKLDPRDRPTAEELLADEWFTEESEDTREPLPVSREVQQTAEAKKDGE